MTMLTFKCRDCGKVFQAEDEFGFMFANSPNPDDVHPGQCNQCKKSEIARLTAEYDPKTDNDLAKECHTDGSEWK